MMQRKKLDYQLAIKSLDDAGTFEGYATVWNDIDAYGETVAKGAVKKSLKARNPAMLWQHNASIPVGVWSDIKEDDTGLAVSGNLALDAQVGKDAYALMKIGAVKGLSIGFIPVKFKVDKETQLLTHTEIDLWEVSVVTFPALASAEIDSVKSFFGAEMPPEREVEEFLRDAGLSRTLAKTFISRGYKACLRDADKEGIEVVEIENQLKSLLEIIKNGRN